MSDQVDLTLEARNRILAKHQSKALCRWLAYCLSLKGRPVSANDARALLDAAGITVLEKRMFGGLFPARQWQQVGWTKVIGPGHARRIGTFLPRDGAVFDPVEQP